MFALHEDEEHEQVLSNAQEVDDVTCSCDTFSQVSGLRFCRRIRFAVPTSDVTALPVFPLVADWSVEKTDAHARYEFELRAETQRERVDGRMTRTHVARLYFDTPDSRTDRKLLLETLVDANMEHLSAKLETPWKKVSLDASMTSQRSGFAVTSLLNVDGDDVISFATALETREVENGKCVLC